MAETATIEQQAVAWHLRLADLAGEEWEAFTGWLETAPEHRAAYDRVADAEAFLDAAAPALGTAASVAPSAFAPMPAVVPLARRRFWPLASAAAAAGLALLGAWALWPDMARLQLESTRPGTTKEIAFADGTRIDLNGGSALALDQAHPRAVRLDGGEALFHVRHQDRPFTVEVAGYAIRDLGTVFNVALTDRTLRLDVSEGSVLFDPGGANLTLKAGQGITLDRGHNLVVQRASHGAGGWLGGEMAFDDARLEDVAAALHQRYGVNITLSGGLPGRPFTGNVRSEGSEADIVAHFASLIGAQFHRDGDTWVLTPGA
jgi:transmembrane sensor